MEGLGGLHQGQTRGNGHCRAVWHRELFGECSFDEGVEGQAPQPVGRRGPQSGQGDGGDLLQDTSGSKPAGGLGQAFRRSGEVGHQVATRRNPVGDRRPDRDLRDIPAKRRRTAGRSLEHGVRCFGGPEPEELPQLRGGKGRWRD